MPKNIENADVDVEAVLDGIMIAAPCDVSWESMEGDDRVRFCGSCKLNVYNTRAMTKLEVAELMSREGRLPCLRIYRRFDGTLITDDCPVGLRKIRDAYKRAARRVAAGWAAIVSVVTGVLPVWGQQGPVKQDRVLNAVDIQHMVMGWPNGLPPDPLVPAVDGPDTRARKVVMNLYGQAIEAERIHSPLADDYYRQAIASMQGTHQDPKYAERVYRDFALYLDGCGRHDDSLAVLNEFKKYKEWLTEEHRILYAKIDALDESCRRHYFESLSLFKRADESPKR